MPPSPSTFAQKYGPWALVTGASSGIGAEFCHSFAKRGLNVILVARRAHRLESLAADLSAAYSIQTLVLPFDLTKPESASQIAAAVADLDVGLLVNNAGTSAMGAYLNESQDHIEHLIALNVTAVAALARLIGPRLAKRKRGGMIFVSSLAARANPYFALYAASKAFVTTLAVSLRYELCEYGVEVMSFEPGFVESELVERGRACFESGKIPFDVMPTEQAVESCLAAFGKEDVHTPGWMNGLWRFMRNFLPSWYTCPSTADFMRKNVKSERTTLAL